MATIITRVGKGSGVTNTELDNNFVNLNTELGTKSSGSFTGVVSTPNIEALSLIANSMPGIRPALNLDFVNTTALDSRVTFTRTSSASRINSMGFIETAAQNTPRFDYDSVTLAPRGLLIEEQRTNLLLYSAQFDNAVWVGFQRTIVPNALNAPNNSVSAAKLVEDTTLSAHYIVQSFSTISSTTYTFSVYLKAAERNFAFVGFNTGSMATTFVSVNLTTGVVLTAVGTPIAVSSVSANNGWWRVSVTLTSTGSVASTVDIRTSIDGVWANHSYTGDGVSGIYIWGAQLEAGAFFTSYITSTAAQTTRAADAAVMLSTNFSSWYNPLEGTLYGAALIDNATRASTPRYPGTASLDAGSGTNALHLYFNIAPPIKTTGQEIFVAGVWTLVGAIVQPVVLDNTVIKQAISYKANNAASAAGGVVSTTSTSAVIPTVTTLRIGNGRGGALHLNGYVQRIIYYPLRLSNSTLQALTK